jgi:hypothetical protein
MLFAFVGSAGQAIFFVLSLVAWTVVAAYTFSYAAHCYLVVTQGTSSGLDRVEWGDEPILDWLYEALYAGGIVLIWLAPAGLLWRGLSRDLLPDDPGLRFLLLAVPGLWLLFPVGLLSSLASSSRWVPLSPRVLGRLLRILPSMVLFYFITGVLFVAASACTYFGLFTPGWYVLPIASVVGSSVLLIHARLVGRIAWLMGQLDDKQRPEKKAPTSSGKRPKPALARAGRRKRAISSQDPWAMPEEDVAEQDPSREEPPVPGYKVVEVEEKEQLPPRPSYVEPEPDPYALAEPQPEPEPPPLEPSILEREKAHIEREIKLRERVPPNPPPAFPLFSGVFNFPGYPTSLKAWLWLILGGLATGTVGRVVISMFPFRS